jgi:hypothetical protein
MRIFVVTLTGSKHQIDDVDASDTVEDIKSMIQDEIGIPMDQQRLIVTGRQLEYGSTLGEYLVQNESILRLVLNLRGMISTFTSADKDDPLVAYLMLTEEERASAEVPIDALRAKAKAECTQKFHTLCFDDHEEILHETQRALLCRLLDFVWSKTASPEDANCVDMRLVIEDENFLAVLEALDCSVDANYSNARIVLRKLQGGFPTTLQCGLQDSTSDHAGTDEHVYRVPL